MNPTGQPQPGVPGTITMTNDQLQSMIQNLQTNITTDVESRLTAQNADLEERLKPINDIQATLEQARQAQLAEQQRQQQQQNPGWVPRTWEDVNKQIESRAQEISKNTLDERDRQAQARIDRERRDEQELESQIDAQIAELEKSGYIPRTINPNDYNDPGVSAKRELLTRASYIGSPELNKVAEELAREHQRNQVWDPQTSSFREHNGLTPLPGKNAPVGLGGVNAPSQPTGPSYAQIHGARDLDSLVALAEQQGAGPLPPDLPNMNAANAFFGTPQ